MNLLIRSRSVWTRLSTPVLYRHFHSGCVLRISDYGRSEQAGKPDGAVVPQYSGPSIGEKKKGKGVTAQGKNDKWEEPTTDKMANRQEEVSDRQYEKDSKHDFGLSTDDAPEPHLRDRATDTSKARRIQTNKGLDNMGDSTVRQMHTSAGRRAPIDSRGRVPPSPLEHTSPVMQHDHPSSVGEEIKEGARDLKEDARDLKEEAQEKMSDARQTMSHVTEDLSERGHEMLGKVKKSARDLTEKARHVMKEATTPVYEDTSDGMYPTSDAKNERGGVKMPMSSPESAASASGGSMGGDVNAVRKSLFDGPQDMPQGVGKRALNERGEPMETGRKGS